MHHNYGYDIYDTVRDILNNAPAQWHTVGDIARAINRHKALGYKNQSREMNLLKRRVATAARNLAKLGKAQKEQRQIEISKVTYYVYKAI